MVMWHGIRLLLVIGYLVSGGGMVASTALAPLVPHRTIAPTATPVYIAVGASDAFGVGTDDPLTQSWPHDIATKLNPAPHLINLGIPGATVNLATRAELPIVLAIQPMLVTVWLGVNDFDDRVPLATFEQQLQSLLRQMTQMPMSQVFVGNLPDLALLPHFASWDQSALNTQVNAWNAAIRNACTVTGAHLVDIYARWNDLTTHPEYLGPDHFHPSTLGAQKIADLFVSEITQTTATTP
jgi:acyl-CoA thioesterase I